MKRCAYLSMDRLDDFVVYDEMTYAPLADLGWDVETVSWRRPDVEWSIYDLVVIRTTWDYHQDPDAFLEVLETIDASAARLENALDLVRWNLSKTYLRDLEGRGVDIVPTAWGYDLNGAQVADLFDALGAEAIVAKPVVSANADDTFWLTRASLEARRADLAMAFRNRAYMAQPFMASVVEEGEYSLFYFGGAYSHTILKTPKPADFRVQEEHGGRIRAATPEDALQCAADVVMAAVTPTPLYARVDLVRTGADGFALMELELIEPSLYFPYDPASPERFARALDMCARA